jgi:hypothetical protein
MAWGRCRPRASQVSGRPRWRAPWWPRCCSGPTCRWCRGQRPRPAG